MPEVLRLLQGARVKMTRAPEQELALNGIALSQLQFFPAVVAPCLPLQGLVPLFLPWAFQPPGSIHMSVHEYNQLVQSA